MGWERSGFQIREGRRRRDNATGRLWVQLAESGGEDKWGDLARRSCEMSGQGEDRRAATRPHLHDDWVEACTLHTLPKRRKAKRKRKEKGEREVEEP